MNTFKVGLLLTALTLLFVLLGGWLGGPTGMILALAIALVMNVGSYWYSDRIVLRMTGAEPLSREAAPALHAMTERLAARAGIPTPGLYLVPDPQPNAFATGRSPGRGVVAVNQGLLDLLSPEEVEGVIAHEVAHLSIVNPLAGGAAGGFARLFSTHPPTGDRVAALRALDLTAQPRRNAPRRAVLG